MPRVRDVPLAGGRVRGVLGGAGHGGVPAVRRRGRVRRLRAAHAQVRGVPHAAAAARARRPARARARSSARVRLRAQRATR